MYIVHCENATTRYSFATQSSKETLYHRCITINANVPPNNQLHVHVLKKAYHNQRFTLHQCPVIMQLLSHSNTNALDNTKLLPPIQHLHDPFLQQLHQSDSLSFHTKCPRTPPTRLYSAFFDQATNKSTLICKPTYMYRLWYMYNVI